MKHDDPTWREMEAAFVELRDISAERARLDRMWEQASVKERNAMERVRLALTNVRKKQEAK